MQLSRSDMDEGRVAVKLTNAVDEALVRRGALTPAEVRTYDADALVDTGAVRMVVPPQVATRLDSRRRRLVPNPAHPDQPITKVKCAAAAGVTLLCP